MRISDWSSDVCSSDLPALRFALAGMVRRRGHTVTQLCALSVGLMIMLLLAITRNDLLQGWQSTLPPDAPNTFLINIQPDQRQAVAQRLERSGLGSVQLSPMVRGRLVAINEKPDRKSTRLNSSH